MLLAADIGNTNISLGVFDGENLIEHWRLPTDRQQTFDELGVSIRRLFALSAVDYQKISAIIVSSVVPPLDSGFQMMSEKIFGRAAVFVDSASDFNLKIKYNPPSSVGVDRLVAASAAKEKYGVPCVVCDFGTAATIDAVNSKGEYLGGTIAPGISLFADALFQKTSKLPKVEIEKPESVIGNSTVKSIQAGIYFGYVGLVKGILEKMLAELGGESKVVATGGFARLIAADCESIEIVDDDLILEGLRLIYARSK